MGADNQKKTTKQSKKPLPAAPQANIPVDLHWKESYTHKCETGKEELTKNLIFKNYSKSSTKPKGKHLDMTTSS